jgi:SPOR domain
MSNAAISSFAIEKARARRIRFLATFATVASLGAVFGAVERMERDRSERGAALAEVGKAPSSPVPAWTQTVESRTALAAPRVEPVVARPPVRPASAIVPHKTRTLRVRPDGSVIGDDDGRADARADALLARLAPGAPAPAASAPSASTPAPAASIATPAAQPSVVSLDIPPPAPPLAPAEVAPEPASAPRPAVATTPAVSGETVVARDDAPPAPRPVGVAVAFARGYFIQLAASPSEDEARKLAARFRERLSAGLGARDLSIQQANVKEKSFYRVRVADLSRDEATQLCARLRSERAACFVAHE